MKEFSKKKLIIIAVIFLLVVSVVVGSVVVLNRRNKQLDNTVISDLSRGECGGVTEARLQSRATSSDKRESAEAYDKLASCYSFKLDFAQAVGAYENAIQKYAELSDEQAKQRLERDLNNAKIFVELQKNPPVEDEDVKEGWLQNSGGADDASSSQQ